MCLYALQDTADSLEEALQELRIADAKHRLAYVLIRSAFLDIDRGKYETAIAKAAEALEYATLLERDTETTLANLVLVLAYHQCGDQAKCDDHLPAVQQSIAKPIAVWAVNRARSELQAIGYD